MVRFPLLFAIAALLCATALQAQDEAPPAQEGRPPLFVSLLIGPNVTTWSNVKPGFGVGVAAGQVINERTCIGVEVMYLYNTMDSETYWGTTVRGDLQQIPVLATLRRDIRPLGDNTGWSLQLCGSVGAVSQKLTAKAYGVSASQSQWAFALGGQAMAVYKVDDSTSFNLGLRIIWTAKTDLNERAGANIMPTAGFSIRF